MKPSKQALIMAAVTGVLPSSTQAALLNQNLILNPSFENVSVRDALDWSGNVTTYSYSLNYTGPAPAGAGNYFWFGGGGDPLGHQSIDVTGNIADIDAGLLNYSLSAFFSTYLTQRDFGTVRTLFLDGALTEVGRATIGGSVFVGALKNVDNGRYTDARAWGEDANSGAVPPGTRTIRVELDGTIEPGVGSICDSYIDLVNFQLVPVPEPGPIAITLLSLGLGGLWRWSQRRHGPRP